VVVGFHNSYAFLESNLVYTMLNPLGKKRVRVYTMSNSLLRETNSLRIIHHALRLSTIKYSLCNLSIGILFYYISMISGGNRSPTSFSFFNQTQFFSLLFYIANLILSKIYQSPWDRSCTYTLYYTFCPCALASKTYNYLPIDLGRYLPNNRIHANM
jgi:hypothetical protein